MVNLLNNSPDPNFMFKGLVEDSRFLMQRCKFEVNHVPGEANACAEELAKLGANQPKEFVAMDELPVRLSTFSCRIS